MSYRRSVVSKEGRQVGVESLMEYLRIINLNVEITKNYDGVVSERVMVN